MLGGAVLASIMFLFVGSPFLIGRGTGSDLCILGLFGFLCVPFALWQAIRFLNERDDPRNQNPPSDPP